MAEFLPLCDVLFNVISLAGYFCDVVFDVVLGYALYERGRTAYFAAVITLVGISLIASQIVSLRWYLNKQKPSNRTEDNNKLVPTNKSKAGRYAVIAFHCTQMGVLWRYGKLFVPVDLRYVKHEVRDLCMLRLVHAFVEAAPMLLLQLHVLVTMQNESSLSSAEIKLKSLGSIGLTPSLIQTSAIAQQQQRTFKDLNIVSAVLSLFSVCWALASFSKNVRLQNVHRLVLTWLGVIFQFLWRLGTIISRVIALTVYASLYSHWVFLVIILHWISMFLWLISPKNVFHGERISRVRKGTLAGMIAFVYVFAYINLQEVNHKQKMITFYVVMFLENWLLVCLWMVGIWSNRPESWYIVPILVFSTFLAGMFFMILYYRYFHVRRLGYESGGRVPNDPNQCSIENGRVTHLDCDESKYPHVIPGVFNCRFTNPVGNGATKRKKKKPTTFIPPPTINGPSSQHSSTDQSMSGLMSIPFWRRPLPRSQAGSSENEGSVSSRVNIHQKLQEKKQKQLAELKIIEEEIKQGKLGGPAGTGTLSSGDDGRGSLPRQPIPRVKKHIDLEPMEWRTPSPAEKAYNDLNSLSPNLDEINNLNKYSTNYDSIYNTFGLNGINISALAKFTSEAKDNFAAMENSNRNMSPISSQISATESNSLTRQVVPRAKIPHNIPRNPFAENFRGHLGNMYAEAAAGSNRPPSISPRNTANSPNRTNLYDQHHGGLYLEVNHPRQISGTYSSSVENSGVENLPFPYNVVPPPRSKLDSRGNTQVLLNQQQNNLNSGGSNNNTASKLTQRQIQRAKTPEILLAPHYLENSRIYYDWGREPAVYRMHEGERNQTVSSGDENLDVADDICLGSGQNPHRIPSDIDSQVSLPRSYTLPREFKYYRRNKARKVIKNEHFIASTNSSDGDVDSCDDNESEHQSNLSNPTSSHSQQRTHPNIISRPASNFHTPTNNFSNISPNSTAVKPQQHNPTAICVNSNLSRSPVPINQSPVNYPGNGKIISNLDLISNVVEPVVGTTTGNVLNRMRMRVYGGGKGLMVRHETKL